MRRGAWVVALLLGLCALALPARAQARDCGQPGGAWPTASANEQGLNEDQLMRALHTYQDRRGYAVRIFRHGCLVARDTNSGDSVLVEGWELTSSIVALVVARAMTEGLLAPGDVVGSLVTEADKQHGAIRVVDLLQRASGLQNEPDNIYLRDRLALALNRPITASPGKAFGDAPVARALLVATLERAVKEDIESYTARELFAPLGIKRWQWTRDRSRRAVATFGLRLTADDLARVGALLLSRGVWQGRRIIDERTIDAALAPSPSNPCMGWLIWLNARPNCSGSGRRLLPGLPSDLWSWAGYQDQRVTGIPSLGLLVVRYGASAGDAREGVDGLTWERDVLLQLLGAVRDPPVSPAADVGDVPPAIGSAYRDNLGSWWEPVPSLPGRGPRRTRMPIVTPYREQAGKKRLLGVRVKCPSVPGRDCAGSARLVGVVARNRRWSAPAGSTTTVMFRLAKRLPRARDIDVEIHAEDDAGGVTTGTTLHARR
ncbi:MAG TPA: serine hydrolase [Solirubrobacteraceae bacterium]